MNAKTNLRKWTVPCACSSNNYNVISCMGNVSRTFCRECGGRKSMVKLREYACWSSMKRRCYNKLDSAYKYYGGSGIWVCKRWRDSFHKFLADLGPAPSLAHSIERIDGTKGYYPENCRWATPRDQARNTRRNKWHVFNGKKMLIKDIAEQEGVPYGRLYSRVRNGMTINQALSLPVGARQKISS